jgi:hypothetical protein
LSVISSAPSAGGSRVTTRIRSTTGGHTRPVSSSSHSVPSVPSGSSRSRRAGFVHNAHARTRLRAIGGEGSQRVRLPHGTAVRLRRRTRSGQARGAARLVNGWEPGDVSGLAVGHRVGAGRNDQTSGGRDRERRSSPPHRLSSLARRRRRRGLLSQATRGRNFGPRARTRALLCEEQPSSSGASLRARWCP